MMLAIVNDRFDMAAMLLELGADANDGSLFYAVEMRDAPTDWRARDGSRLRADHPNQLTALELDRTVARRRRRSEQAVHGPDALGVDVLRHERLGHAVLSRGGRRRRRGDEAPDRAPAPISRRTPPPVEGAPPMPFGDNTGLTPLMAALNGGKGMLMAGGPGDIREGKIGIFREPGNRNPADAVKLLLEAGANPNALSANGDTALHIAAYDGRLEADSRAGRGRRRPQPARREKASRRSSSSRSMEPRKLEPDRGDGRDVRRRRSAEGNGGVSARAIAARDRDRAALP